VRNAVPAAMSMHGRLNDARRGNAGGRRQHDHKVIDAMAVQTCDAIHPQPAGLQRSTIKRHR
ncbi:hypothetical protein, partial [Xanthomonas arboricola]|uniref:hypothetical protein n=1 Tax=Xanthomonas arboricola TaxID=56448 RepID=UPI001C6122EF